MKYNRTLKDNKYIVCLKRNADNDWYYIEEEDGIYSPYPIVHCGDVDYNTLEWEEKEYDDLFGDYIHFPRKCQCCGKYPKIKIKRWRRYAEASCKDKSGVPHRFVGHHYANKMTNNQMLNDIIDRWNGDK